MSLDAMISNGIYLPIIHYHHQSQMSRKKYLSKEFSLKGKSEIDSKGGEYAVEKVPFCFKMLLKMG
jgi:hypothetical protein